jgi:hypothetical protein
VSTNKASAARDKPAAPGSVSKHASLECRLEEFGHYLPIAPVTEMNSTPFAGRIPRWSDSRPLFCCSCPGAAIGNGLMVVIWAVEEEKVYGGGMTGATTVTKTVGEGGGGGRV